MNHYDMKAREVERRLLSKWSERSIFLTGKGNENSICGLTSDRIVFRTSKSKVKHYINRLKLRKSIAFLLAKKTATRKELEKYSHMNSALLGLLKHLFIETAKISTSAGGLLRLTIKGVRYFFSGLERASRKDREAIKVNGATSILASYYYLRESNSPKLLQFIHDNNMELLLDSGEFSAYKARMKNGKQKPIDIYAYANFIKKYNHLVWGYFNLDVTSDAGQSQLNYELLHELTGRKPIPIWHPNVNEWRDSDWQALERLVKEDHAIIGIGGTVHMGIEAGPRMMNKVKDDLFHEIYLRFEEQNFHWLGGSSNLLYKYPMFSADSSGYLQGRKKNQQYFFNGDDISTRINKAITADQCLFDNISLLAKLESSTNPLLFQN